MRVNLYLVSSASKKLIASTDLEVVPNGTYIVDGVTYVTVGKPTFYINRSERTLQHVLTGVDLFVKEQTVDDLLGGERR